MKIFDFDKGFSTASPLRAKERATIAISANIIDENSALHFAYSKAVIDAGASPIIIPASDNYEAIASILDGVDGIIFSGGADIDAQYFGQTNIEGLTDLLPQRDYYEFVLLRAALDRSIPIFAICRGVQLINIALGGDIYQDLPSMYERKSELLNHSILKDKHLAVHPVDITQGSMLHQIIGKDSVGVNSRHHQAIDKVAPMLRVNSRSQDGVIEGVEGYPHLKILGVQWHPENMAADGDNSDMKKLFSFFAKEAMLFKRAKKIHAHNPIVDSHCDTPMLYDGVGFDLACRNKEAKLDIVKMREGHLDMAITVAYIPQQTPFEQAHEQAVSTLNRFVADICANKQYLSLATSATQVMSAKLNGLKSIMLGIENGLAIGNDLDNINKFADMGVVYITLCHNGTNHICDSAKGETMHNGLSDFGKQVIERMNQLGVIIDVSHSSHKSTMDAVNLSTKPIIASHSSAKALCDHPRNLSDEAICAIAQKGGVVQVCGYGGFLNSDNNATIIDLIKHIEHIGSLVGYDHVGIGSDFDGDGGVVGFCDASDYINITVELLRRGHSQDQIAKIMGGNILRILTNK